MIRTIKSCLYKLVGRDSCDYFHFLAVLADVQRDINDKPLTYRSPMDMGLEIITPNHFLSPLTNPKLILRLEDFSLDIVDPPRRKLVLLPIEIN